MTSASLLAAASASAQDQAAQPVRGEEPADSAESDSAIIVTAQKRSESVLDVAAAVSVVGEEQLQRQQVTSLQDLGRTTPQLVVTQGGEGNPGGGVIIRGIGTQAFSRSASSSVGIVVDGVPTGNVNITNLFDVARVEVLAGPQGTLFGDSVSAGVLNIVTNSPVLGAIEGRVGADYVPRLDRISQLNLRGVINLPLGDLAAVRVSGFRNDSSGPVYNTYHDEWAGQEQYGGRVRLLVEPADRLTINLIADYSHSTSNEFFFTYIYADTNPLLQSLLATCGITASRDNFERCGSGRTDSLTENWGISGQVDLDVGDHTLTSITSFRDQDTLVFADVDGLPFATTVNPGTIPVVPPGATDIESGPETHPADLLTQELRVTSPAGQTVEYVVGAFYQRYRSHHIQPATVTPGVPPLAVINAFQETITDKKDYAIFGQATVNFTDTTRAIVGARYNWSSIDDTYNNRDQLVFRFTPPGTISIPFTGVVNGNVENFSFKLGLQHDVTDNANVYGTITRGYKNPQANNADRTAEPYLVKEELPMYYEVGGKAGFFGERLVLSAGVYYADIKNFQDQFCPAQTETNPNPACVSTNIDGVTSRGFDLLLFGNPMPELSLSAGVSYAKTTYPDPFFRNGANGQVNIGGQQLGLAPRWRATFSGDYRIDLSETLVGVVGLDADYQTDVGINIDNVPFGNVPARLNLGARLGIRVDDLYSATLFARNLTDNRNPFAAAGPVFAGTSSAWYGTNSGRVIGISLDGNF